MKLRVLIEDLKDKLLESRKDYRLQPSHIYRSVDRILRRHKIKKHKMAPSFSKVDRRLTDSGKQRNLGRHIGRKALLTYTET